MSCTKCGFHPQCSSQLEMEQRHGDPSEFNEALEAAFRQGFISRDEAVRASERYSNDWNHTPALPLTTTPVELPPAEPTVVEPTPETDGEVSVEKVDIYV